MIDAKEVAHYQENGYLHVEGVLEGDFLEALQRESAALIDRLQTSGIPSGQGLYREAVAEGQDPTTGAIFSIHNLPQHHAVFTRLLLHPPLVSTLEALIGPGVALHHARMITKGSAQQTSASKGWARPMHQDQPFFPHRDHSAVAAFMPMVDTTLENGALHVVPGSHRQGPIPHSEAGTGFDLDPQEWPLERGKPVLARAGDVIFFNYLLVHGSGPNLSAARRTALIYQFRAAGDVPLNAAHSDEVGYGMLLA